MKPTGHAPYNSRPYRQSGDIAGLERLIADSARAYVEQHSIDALLEQGRALGGIVMPIESPVLQNLAERQPTQADQPSEQLSHSSVPAAAEPTRPESYVKFEIDLARVCRSRGEERTWRVWTYGQRAHDGSGKIEKDAFFEHLRRLGVIVSRRTFDDIITAGMGTYWTAGYSRNAEGVESLHLYITGQKRLNTRITEQELKMRPVSVDRTAPCQTPITLRSIDTNRPGSAYVWADLTGELADVRATVYSAWMSVKAQQHGYIDISRRLLQALWKTPRKTLIQWEKRTRMRVQPVYCESYDPLAPLVPSYAYPALDVTGHEIATWRESNRYYPIPVDIHKHGGQRRKIRRAVNAEIEASEPSVDNGGGLRTGRINFEHERVTAKCVEVRADGTKRYGQVIKAPEQLLKAHMTRKHPKAEGMPKHRHMLRTGVRHGVVIKELSTGDRMRSIHMRRDLHAEMDQEFRDRRSQYRIGLVARCI